MASPGPGRVPMLARLGRGVALTFVVAGGAAATVSAQNVSPDSIRHIQRVEPLTGPPGTVVTIYSENLPLQARVIVGVGAMHADLGFEEIGEARQEEFGEVSARVRLPRTAPWDRPVYFILFNGVFSPIGISDPFHVTNDEGLVRRTGRLAAGTAQCVTMIDQDDVAYGISGDLGGARPGENVVVDGRYTEATTCGKRGTIEVVRLRRAGS